jgi:hypothetical protein
MASEGPLMPPLISYNGMRSEYLPITRAMLSKMPGGRCTYPPGDVPGMLGFDRNGHYVGGDRPTF